MTPGRLVATQAGTGRSTEATAAPGELRRQEASASRTSLTVTGVVPPDVHSRQRAGRRALVRMFCVNADRHIEGPVGAASCQDVGVPPRKVADRFFTLLLSQSRNLHQRMLDGSAVGVEQHEETLTESLLLEVARRAPNVTVRTYSRQQESRVTGADWAWWWQGERRWFGALVQAKRLDPHSGRYNFGYTPRSSTRNTSPQRQIDLLMAAARDLELPPLYVLYNGPEFAIDPVQWNCDQIAFDPSAMGATILPAALAAWLMSFDATNSAVVTEFARPLPCHVCPQSCASFEALTWYLGDPVSAHPGVLGFPDDTTTSDLAFRAAASYLASLANGRIRQFRAAPSSPEIAVVRQGVREAPPDYVSILLDATDGQSIADVDGAPERVVVMRQSAQ
jgi:hypothetical protein